MAGRLENNQRHIAIQLRFRQTNNVEHRIDNDLLYLYSASVIGIRHIEYRHIANATTLTAPFSHNNFLFKHPHTIFNTLHFHFLNINHPKQLPKFSLMTQLPEQEAPTANFSN